MNNARIACLSAFAALTVALGASVPACGPADVESTAGTAGSAGAGGGGTTTTAPEPDPSDAIFDPEHVVEVAIDMAPADWDTLRYQSRSLLEMLGPGCDEGPHDSPYTYFPATVTVDGEKLETSAVRKKGFLGSASLSKPSLKVSFDEYVAGRELFGLEGLTLNNSRQDPSLVKTCLAMKVFRDAGVPASRCNFAHVTVNGADLGVYVHIEPVGKRLLRRHFSDDTGNLYEGQLSDFRTGWSATYEKKTNEMDPDRSDIDAVTSALEKNDAELPAALDQVIDIDAFNRFWATEVLVAAWDGYTNNLNNHFVYHDPTSGKMAFLPWGPDMSFDEDDPFLPGTRPQSVSAKGTLPRRLYALPEHREQYVARLSEILDTAWKESDLLAEIDRVQKLIVPYLDEADVPTQAAASDAVRAFVNGRRATITAELSPAAPDWPYPAPSAACLSLVGTVSGTFSTTFGTLNQGSPFSQGTGVFDIEIPVGTTATASPVGSMAGYEDSPSGRLQVVMVGVFPDGKTRALVFNIAQEVFTAGGDGVFDWQSVFGVGVELLGPNDFQVFGLLGDGQLHLDEASATPDAPVTGSFSATVLSSFLQ